jgi:DNA-binding transcriptional regulator YiaG
MPNFAVVMKDEIKRLARKEVRKGTPTLRRNSAKFRRDIAALKKEIKQLARKLTYLLSAETRKSVASPSVNGDKQVRFSPKWLKSHRDKLNLSAIDYGRLVGVSLQTIYQWEQGKTSPRRSQLASLAAVRGMRKREAQQKLELITSQNGSKPKGKRGRPKKKKK